MNDLTIITPTTGSKHLSKAISSVQEQTKKVTHLIVVDGPECIDDVHRQIPVKPIMPIEILVLPENVGRYNGKDYYGHRVYSGIPAVVNSDFISFLDEDNWVWPTFAQKMLDAVQKNGALIATCRRGIYAENETFICNDDLRVSATTDSTSCTIPIRTCLTESITSGTCRPSSTATGALTDP